MSIRNSLMKLSLFEKLFYLSLFAFSSWLMFATFSYDSNAGMMILAPIVQSDFAANIPLIRSFSLGENWPPEYPLFPGQPIQYHFLFYFLVAMLEKIGFRIDWALNTLSIAGFFAMLAMTCAIAKKIFNDTRVAVLSTLFLIFNGTLSFWYYFNTKASFSWSALKQIVFSRDYASFGPWDGSPVLIFWNLNTYINQRHFCLALGILLVFIFTCLNIANQKRIVQIGAGIAFGLIFGLFPLLHKPVMLLAGMVMAVYFIAFARMRLFLLFSGGIALIMMILLHFFSFKIGAGDNTIGWNLGFLVNNPKSIKSYLSFFLHQFGFHCFLIPVGFLLASRQVKIVMLPAIIALIVTFTVKFSVDVSANHKLINFSLIMLQMLTAFCIVLIYDAAGAFFWNAAKKSHVVAMSAIKATLGILLLLLMFSGIMDLFVVINQDKGTRLDTKSSETIEWITKNTPKDAVFLNPSFIFDNASIAGRKIFLGYAYFVVSAGYDFGERANIYREIYTSDDPYRILKLLHQNNISYVSFNDEMRNGDNLEVTKDTSKKGGNETVFKEFFPLAFKEKTDIYGKTVIYKVPSEKEWLASLSADQKKEAEKLRIKNQGDNFITPELLVGSNKLVGHVSLNLDSENNIYLLEIASSTIKKYSPDGYLLATIGSQGDGPGQMKDPNGLATDKSGNIYIADTVNHRAQKLSSAGNAMKGWGADLKLFAPSRIRIADDNSVYILDTGHHRVVHASPSGELITAFGSQGDKDGELHEPTDMVIIGDNLYIADTFNSRISIFDLNGKFIKSWPVTHWEARSWNKFRLAWNQKSEQLYITNFVTGNIFVHTKDGKYLGTITPVSKNKVDGISDIFVSKDQELFAYDITNAQLLKIHNLTPVKP